MPATGRKRKVSGEDTPDDTNIIGGMKGDYRVTGMETSSDYQSFTVLGENDKDIPCQSRGSGQATTLIFTHGAGGGLENPATKYFAEGYARQAPVICFQGTMNLKSRVKSFESVVNCSQGEDPKKEWTVGGRSMGARAAVMIAQEHKDIKKLVLVSYPLTSPKGELRDQILLDLPEDKQVLFMIGSRDEMCDLDELKKVRDKMRATSKLVVVEGGDHGMSLAIGLKGKEKEDAVEVVRKASGELAAKWAKDANSIRDEHHLRSEDLKHEATPSEHKEHDQEGQSSHERKTIPKSSKRGDTTKGSSKSHKTDRNDENDSRQLRRSKRRKV